MSPGLVDVANAAGWSFHEKPYRHYELDGSRTTPNGLEILSVTQALGIIDKSGPLQGYAARETLVGCADLLRRYGLVKDSDGLLPTEVDLEDLCLIAGDPKYMGQQLYRYGLTFRQKTSDAAARGTAIHKVLEDWADHGTIPDPRKHVEARRGYVRSAASWLLAQRPTFEESESIVGSAEHGYAGTCDTALVFHDGDLGRCVVDYKTSKAVYPSSHFRQIAAYSRGRREAGMPPADRHGILLIYADGTPAEITWLEDHGSLDFFEAAFLRALAACRDERAIEARSKAMVAEVKAAEKAITKAARDAERLAAKVEAARVKAAAKAAR